MKFYGSKNLQQGELAFGKMFDRDLPCSIVTEDAELREHAAKHGIQPLSLEEALGISQEESKEAVPGGERRLCIVHGRVPADVLKQVVDSKEWIVQIVIGTIAISERLLVPKADSLPFAPP